MSGKYRTIVAFILLFLCTESIAQEEFSLQPRKRGAYAWVATFGGGAGYFVSNNGAPPYLSRKVSNLSHVASFRLMWHPDHLLNVGLETGHLTFYTYRFATLSTAKEWCDCLLFRHW
jgi:hypothetical protein